eukprot:40039-Pleurochrysis_carterae.AAC.2
MGASMGPMDLNSVDGLSSTTESDNYSHTLDVLGKIKDTVDASTGTELDLPMLCVVGDQTSGKSSLLEALTGVKFPVKSGTCTRMPIRVRCRNADEKGVWLISSDGTQRKLNDETMDDQIGEAQQSMIEGDGFSTDRSLHLEARGPDQMELILVDLPGLINHGEQVEAVYAMIEGYVEKAQTLVLLVNEAKQDPELVGALALAEKHDPKSKRTLRVLSKFDNFDSKESREAACKTVAEQHTQLLGAHAVICRFEGGAKYESAVEQETLEKFFSNTPTNSIHGRLGIAALKSRLPIVFEQLIRTNLPALKVKATDKLTAAQKELASLGYQPLESHKMVEEAQKAILAVKPTLGKSLTPAIETFKEGVFVTLSSDSITEERVREDYQHDAFESPFFAGETTFAAVMHDVIANVHGFYDAMAEELRVQLFHFFERPKYPASVSPRLQGAIKRRWEAVVAEMLNKLRGKALDLINEAAEHGTMDKALHDNFVSFEWNGNEQGSLAERGARRVHRAVQAHCECERKNLIDAVLKAVKHIVLKRHVAFVHTDLMIAPIINEACEEEHTAKHRHALLNEISTLRSCLDEINKLDA